MSSKASTLTIRRSARDYVAFDVAAHVALLVEKLAIGCNYRDFNPDFISSYYVDAFTFAGSFADTHMYDVKEEMIMVSRLLGLAETIHNQSQIDSLAVYGLVDANQLYWYVKLFGRKDGK